MSDMTTSMYEGLFLFPQSAVADMQSAVDHVNSILDRADAEVVALSKWEERRLAYDIKGNKRGIYFLAYFKVAHDKLTTIERDCNLSEQLLRALVTRADHVPQEMIEGSEGREQLADEIKMRDTAEETEVPKVVIERAEAEAPKVVAAPAEAEAPKVVAEPTEAEAPKVVAEPAEAEAPKVVAEPAEAEAPKVVAEPAEAEE